MTLTLRREELSELSEFEEAASVAREFVYAAENFLELLEQSEAVRDFLEGREFLWPAERAVQTGLDDSRDAVDALEDVVMSA